MGRQTIAVACRWSGLKRGLHALAQRRGLEFLEFEQLERLLDHCAAARSVVAVVDLHFPRTLHERIKALATAERPVQFVFVSNKPSTPGQPSRVDGLPSTSVVCGDRLVVRGVEAVAQACGAEVRRHFRSDAQLEGRLVGEGEETHLHIENLSTTGVKIRSTVAPRPGEEVRLQIRTNEGELDLRAEVMRAYTGKNGQAHAGLRFTEVEPDQMKNLTRLVRQGPEATEVAEWEAQVRRSPRVRVPPQVSLKVRLGRLSKDPQQARERHYLRVFDVSREGFRGTIAHELELEVGTQYEALFLAKSVSFEARVELVRCQRVESEWHHGFRIVSLSSEARAKLAQLVFRAKELGLKRFAQRRRRADKAPTSRAQPRST